MRHAAIAACCLLAACGNPTDPEGWGKRAESRSRMDEKLQALAEVRKATGDRKAAGKSRMATRGFFSFSAFVSFFGFAAEARSGTTRRSGRTVAASRIFERMRDPAGAGGRRGW